MAPFPLIFAKMAAEDMHVSQTLLDPLSIVGDVIFGLLQHGYRHQRGARQLRECCKALREWVSAPARVAEAFVLAC
jgi:hypothetical protein